MVEIHGVVERGFEGVKDVFAANFERGEEVGARFSLVRDGQVVVDIWAGHADRARSTPFDAQTLAPVHSTTKAIAALLIARLVDAGKLSYETRVAEVWPEFGQAGKGEITVEQVLSHQAGLSGFLEPMEPSLWFDWDALCARIAATPPIWPPGTASGYHPITVGYIVGEVFRRIDGRTMGAALRQDLAGPFDLDLWIGLPDAEHGRVADQVRPTALPRFGELNDATRAAFLVPWSSAAGKGAAEWRRMEVPSANGHATALGLARLFGALANGGWLDGEMILSPALTAELARERIHGQDLVLPFVLSWGAGVLRNQGLDIWGPGGETFGHAGWGGSCVFTDPQARLGGAYVMNKQSTALIGDARARRLIEAAYAAV